MIAARNILTALLLAVMVTSCASLLGAETPEQQFYAAQGVYVIVVDEAVLYSRRPDADPTTVAALRAADKAAYDALLLGRVVLAEVPSEERNRKLVFYATLAQRALAALTAALEEGTGP